MPDWLLDFLLPATDRAARTQWVIAAVFWAGVVPVTLRRSREVGMLAIGLAICTLAWFLLRMVH